MQVRDIAQLVDQFHEGLHWDDFTFEFSEPWHLQRWHEVRVPGEGRPCVYIISKPASPSRLIPIGENASELWYVGKSNRGGGRIWEHLGPVYEAGTSSVAFPKKHRWVNVSSVAASIRDALSDGQAVIYVITVGPQDRLGLPVALERYLMARLYQRYGHFPELNLEL